MKLALLAVWVSGQEPACSCAEEVPLCRAAWTPHAIFVGKALSVDPSGGARFTVSERFGTAGDLGPAASISPTRSGCPATRSAPASAPAPVPRRKRRRTWPFSGPSRIPPSEPG